MNEGERLVQLTSELRRFILPGNDEIEMYTHRTSSEEIARKIINEGFRFSESFQKTTDQIVNDLVYLRYWDTLRKHYGSYVVIIGISKDVFKLVLEKLKTKVEVQQALSTIIKRNDNDGDEDCNYLLPRQYVKGFIRRANGEIEANGSYNPSYIPAYLDKNIDILNKE